MGISISSKGHPYLRSCHRGDIRFSEEGKKKSCSPLPSAWNWRRRVERHAQVEVACFSGLVVNYASEIGALALVRGLRVFSDFEYEFRMGLANKQLAPELETVVIMSDEQHIHISSSTIREIAELGGDVSRMVPPQVFAAMRSKFQSFSNEAQTG